MHHLFLELLACWNVPKMGHLGESLKEFLISYGATTFVCRVQDLLMHLCLWYGRSSSYSVPKHTGKLQMATCTLITTSIQNLLSSAFEKPLKLKHIYIYIYDNICDIYKYVYTCVYIYISYTYKNPPDFKQLGEATKKQLFLAKQILQSPRSSMIPQLPLPTHTTTQTTQWKWAGHTHHTSVWPVE